MISSDHKRRAIVFYPWVFCDGKKAIIKGLNDKTMAISGQQDCIVPLAAGYLFDGRIFRALPAQCSTVLALR
jgi:hypothetical protein